MNALKINLSLVLFSLINAYYFTQSAEATTTPFILQMAITGAMFVAGVLFNKKKGGSHVTQLYNTSKALDIKSGHIGTSFSNLSESNGDQVNQISRLSSSFEEISQMSRNSESIINETKNAFQAAVNVAHEGKQVIENLSKNFKELKSIQEKDAQTNHETIALLNKFSEIFKDVKSKTLLINDVVFQTKLLSFNASVEAARAGAQGKGFSVVAEEIGNLAELSGKTSNQINEMINKSSAFVLETINNSSGNMKSNIERSNKVSTRVASDVSQCVEQFNGIIENIKSIESNITSIEKASAEQRLGIEDGNSALHNLDNLATINQGNINETMTTNEEIKTLIESLNTIASDIFEDVLGIHIEAVTCTDKRILDNYFKIIDVRRAEEFTGDLSHIKNAELHTLGDELTDTLNALDKKSRYLFVCRSGGRSSRAAREAQSMGFKHVYNMSGGMLEYAKRAA